MRTFVAVFPLPEVQRALIEAARNLPIQAFRLTAPERVHLTLKFLGEVRPEDLPRLISALGPATDSVAPFEATTAGFGAFPAPRRARVLWSGVDEGAGKLRTLARAVDDHLEREGFAREDRPFVPHLTLGRARRPVSLDLTSASHPELRFAVPRVDLVQSRPDGPGVTYEILTGFRPPTGGGRAGREPVTGHARPVLARVSRGRSGNR